MLFKRQRKLKLSMNQEEFNAQADQYLNENQFPITAEYRSLFAAFVQHTDETNDNIEYYSIAKRIRKAKINEAAFYLMYPEKLEAKLKKEKEASDAEKEVAKA